MFSMIESPAQRPPTPTTTAGAPCRACGYARAIARVALFTAGGVALSLLLAWVTRQAPIVGVVLGILSIFLLGRALLMALVRPSPLVALAHLATSLGLGLIVAAVVGWLAR